MRSIYRWKITSFVLSDNRVRQFKIPPSFIRSFVKVFRLSCSSSRHFPGLSDKTLHSSSRKYKRYRLCSFGCTERTSLQIYLFITKHVLGKNKWFLTFLSVHSVAATGTSFPFVSFRSFLCWNSILLFLIWFFGKQCALSYPKWRNNASEWMKDHLFRSAQGN